MSNISEDRNMGRIGIVLKEEYDPEKTYTKLNQVTYSGSSYTLKVAEATGILPTNTDYWICSAKKGDQGEKGDKGDVGPIGPKPVNGTDYNTNAEREEFKNAVVADSKADLEKYITEKETQLDNYTKDKETKLDDYVTDTVKPTIDTYVTDTTKKGIDAYEKEKEKVLDTYTDTKKTEIDNYVTNTSKPALDQYEKDKEAELETAKNTAISEYDAHAESVLTETEDLFNALPTEKASGTELYIEDAKPCRVINAGIGGMYKQETTLGININNTKLLTTVTKNGITRTILGDGGINIKGTATAQWNIPIFPKELVRLEEGAYTFVCYGLPTDLSINIYYVGNVSGETVREFTANGTSNYYMNLIVREGTTVNCTLYPFLIKGSYTADNIPKYEPFTDNTPSPNPDYPQEIEQTENLIFINSGLNVVSTLLEDLEQGTIDGAKGLNEESLTRVRHNRFFHINYDEIYANCTIIIPKGYKYAIRTYNKNKKFILDYNAADFIQKLPPSLVGKGVKYIKFVFAKTDNSNITTEEVSKLQIMIAKGVNVSYTPYRKEQAINIDLKGNKLCAVSDTIKDKLLIDRNGNVALQKNVSLIVLSKDNIFSRTVLSNGDILYRTVTNIINSNNIFVLCNYYRGIKGISNRTDGTIYCNNSNRNSIDIIDNNASITTVDEYKTFVENNQIEVYYALATPELIDLGQLPELPKTFNGINNVWAETNLGNTEIEIEYVQDVKKLLEQQNARLDSIEALLSTTETSALLLDNMQEDLEKEVE